MKLFQALDPVNKSAKENWAILNRLDRKITLRRADANTTMLTGTISYYILMVLVSHTLLCKSLLAELLKNEQVQPLLENTAIVQWLEALSYPWYILLAGAVVLVLVVPCMLALLAKVLVLLLVPRLLQSKKEPHLPTEEIPQKKLLTLRTRYLYDRQYHSNGSDLGLWPGYIAAGLFAVVPILLLFLTEIGRAIIDAEGQSAIWIGLLAIIVLAFVFWFASLCLYLLLDKILSPLYWGRHWVSRYTALDTAAKAFYEQWVAVDPEEQENKKRQDEIEARKWEEQKRKDEERTQHMVEWYIQLQKEHEDYLRRLHQWAKEDDIDWTGSGDGI